MLTSFEIIQRKNVWHIETDKIIIYVKFGWFKSKWQIIIV